MHTSERAHTIQQTIKWTVYSLLIINFGFYIYEDWYRAVHTLTAESTFFDWTSEFATSIDESAWFILLFMLELETYVIEDEDWTGRVAKAVHGVRLACYVMIAHTVFAYAAGGIDLQPTVPVEDRSGLCDMVGDNVSFVYNLEYTRVTAENCASLTSDPQLYWLADEPLVSTLDGLRLHRQLEWVDLAEAVIWLVILLAIETVVWLQEKGVTSGSVIRVVSSIKPVLYLVLIGIGVWWATLSHWLYFWDELVWIGGFAAIEMNIRDWREELETAS